MKAADLLLTQIRTHDANPRRHAAADDDMVASVAAAGVLTPVAVAPLPGSTALAEDAAYVLIGGHRRFDAATKAGLATVPAVIRDDLTTEAEQLEAMLVENLHRVDLSPVEEAHAYEQLQLFGMNAAAIAKATGRNAKTVKARLALVALPEQAQQRLHDGQLTLEQAATLVEFQQAAPDLAEELEKATGTGRWDYTVAQAKNTLTRRQHNTALIEEFKALHAVLCKPGVDTNWMALARFPEAMRDPDQHPECLGYIAYGDDSYSQPALVCIDVAAHDLPEEPTGPTPSVNYGGIDAAEQARRDAEYEERRRREAERRAAQAAAREARLRWLHTHLRGALGKSSTRTPLLERLIPILLIGDAEWGTGPDRVQILATHLIATGKDPGPLLHTNIASSNATREAEDHLAADLPGITGTVRVESAYATWLTAWVDYALTADLTGFYEDGHLTVFAAQIDLWTYLTDHGYELTEVDEDHITTITTLSHEAAGDTEDDSEATQ